MREELESNKGEKFYPNHHMWTYCIFLGQFITSDGTKLDLGIYESMPNLKGKYRWSNATVWGNEDSNYSSGSLIYIKDAPDWIGNEIVLEVVKRAKAKGLDVEITNM